MTERLKSKTREEWLAKRNIGIGASEAAAIVGFSPWMTSSALWRIKTGMTPQKDLSDNEAVERGIRMEDAIRRMFAASHPEFKVEYHAFDMLYQPERPWLFATLDGEMTNRETKKKFVLEIKTCEPNGKAGWQEWADGNVKQSYYIQILHQLLATGYDGVYLYAALYGRNGDITLREYLFLREDVLPDMEWLLPQEEKFWKSVTDGHELVTPLQL